MSFKVSFNYRNSNEDGSNDCQNFYFNNYINVSTDTSSSFVDRQIRDRVSKNLKFSADCIRYDVMYNISERETFHITLNDQNIRLEFPPAFYKIGDVKDILNFINQYISFNFVVDSNTIDRGTLIVKALQNDVELHVSRKLSVMLGFLKFRDYDKENNNICLKLEKDVERHFKFNLVVGFSELRLHSNLFLDTADYQLLVKSPTVTELIDLSNSNHIKMLNMPMNRMRVLRAANVKSACVYLLDMFGKGIFFNYADLQFSVSL